MKAFLDENFLLHNPIAQSLYNNHVKDLPIIDYHNHLSPQEIAENKQFANITEVWLKGDHYKWRAMRANGIDEAFITGGASDKDKFLKWAATVPKTLRNPLYHWTHLELQRYFGIHDLLSSENASEIYEKCNRQLQNESHHAHELLAQMKVEVVCTTDEPTDSLEFHMAHAQSDSLMKLLPTFRPDKYLVVNSSHFATAIQNLESSTGSSIDSYDDLVNGLKRRIDFFHKQGGRLADHGLSHLYQAKASYNLNSILKKAKQGIGVDQDQEAFFGERILIDLAHIYCEKGWTMQLHLGAIRNNNSRLLNLVGADVGCDSIGDYSQAATLSHFLNALDEDSKLPKTILYNLNPRDNEVFATMAGNFNDGSIAGKVQWGSAWWFLDQKDGMEKQINALSNMGLLSQFVGMLTDSRSFLSFPRHEYFRRLLCNLIGQDVVNGELPNDEKLLGQFVSNICYYNAKHYFKF